MGTTSIASTVCDQLYTTNARMVSVLVAPQSSVRNKHAITTFNFQHGDVST